MKILFCAFKNEYGNPKRGLSFEYQNFYNTLENMPGVEVELFPIDDAVNGGEKREMLNQRLIAQVQDKHYDLLFCFLFTEELKKETISFITKNTKTKTFNWFGDDHWRFPVFSRYWAPMFSLVATTDTKAFVGYKKIGITNVIKTQWAANHYFYKPQDPILDKHEYGVTFLGQKYGSRGDYVQFLEKLGLAVQAFGWGWPSGAVGERQKLEVFSFSKINLNFTETPDYGLKSKLKLLARLFIKKELGKYRFNLGSPVANIKSLLGTHRLTIKGRNFEVPACAGFLLTGQSDEDLSEYYVDGKEIVIFKDKYDLYKKCRYYLEHENEREVIARAGYERTIKEHTYEKRFREIFAKIG